MRYGTYDFLLVIHSIGLSRTISEINGNFGRKNANLTATVFNDPVEGVTL